MSDNKFKRLFTAAMLSSTVFGATYYWYKHSEVRYSYSGDEKALAYVGKIVDDIQRRPASRLLWQSVETGEALYNGEAIRTPSNGEVRIQFANSERYIDLEADSLIVIKQSEGDIALDLMEGSLFVNAKGGASEGTEPGLVLTSDGNKVDLSNASATLSKGSNNKIDLQVLEGKASIKDKSGKSQELGSGDAGALGQDGLVFRQDSIQIITPTPSKTIYRYADADSNLDFKWSGFPNDSEITLWIGNSRKNLKPVMTLAPNAKPEAQVPLNIGKYYWKLSAKSPAGQSIGETPIYKNEISTRLTPAVLFPQVDAQIPIQTDFFDMAFKWQSTDQTENVTLEVWEDEQLKKLVTQKSFAKEDSFTLPALKEGTYYWRLSALFFEDKNPYVGKIQKFSIYKQILAKPKIQVDVAWNAEATKDIQYYVEQPKLDLKWEANLPEQVANYRLKVLNENGDTEPVQIKQTKENQNSIPLPKPGRYIASIEALDANGEVIGTSAPKTIQSAELPLLPPPQFDGDISVQASNDGKTELQWKEIPGAKEYVLSIFKNGKEIRKTNYSKNTTALKNLMPGEYEVRLQALDNYGRASEIGEAKKILVPDKSGLKAPSLKKIKVN